MNPAILRGSKISDKTVLPPKAAPVPEPDLPVWEEATSVVSSPVNSEWPMSHGTLSLGCVLVSVIWVLARRLLKR